MNKKLLRLFIALLIYVLLMYILPIIVPDYSKLLESGSIASWLTPELYSIILNVTIYIILFVTLIFTVKQELVGEIKDLKTIEKKDIFANSVVGYFLLIVGTSIGSTITIALGGTGNSENQEAISTVLRSEYGFLMIVCVAIIGPICEEIIFRKTIFSICDHFKINKIITIIISSCLFGLIHVTSGGDYVEVFPYIFMGVAMGISYTISKTLLVPTIVHIFQNSLSIFSILYLLPLLERLEQLVQ